MSEKKKVKLSLKKGELFIYLLIWGIIFLMPLIFSNSNSVYNWNRIYREWIRTAPFFVIFCIHNYLIFPLFFDGRKLYYLILSLIVIVGIGLLGDLVGRLVMQAPSPLNQPIGRIPQDMLRGPGPIPQIRPWHVTIINNLIVSGLVVGFNTAIKLAVKWQDEEQKNKELEKQKLQSELALLRNQVSPHFFMNTLNNIHALIDINSEDAKNSIIKLSKLMRYMLYDTEQGKTTLKKEIEFIQNYIDLMKLRFTEDVNIKLDFPEKIPNTEIPPMIFTSLVENAFKHGISYQEESTIGIYMKIDKDWLYFRSENSNHDLAKEEGGLGLKNLQKRLELIYKNNFSFEYGIKGNIFETIVKIPFDEN
ncbi:MAG: histidine kinase [Mariniphaga sp.]|nr:histidine kinase [Mariniphaga sp.]